MAPDAETEFLERCRAAIASEAMLASPELMALESAHSYATLCIGYGASRFTCDKAMRDLWRVYLAFEAWQRRRTRPLPQLPEWGVVVRQRWHHPYVLIDTDVVLANGDVRVAPLKVYQKASGRMDEVFTFEGYGRDYLYETDTCKYVIESWLAGDVPAWLRQLFERQP